jgi:hypothetical protein
MDSTSLRWIVGPTIVVKVCFGKIFVYEAYGGFVEKSRPVCRDLVGAKALNSRE